MSAGLSGGARIVVVERESIIRLDMSEILRAAGYQVVAETGSGAQAVALTLFLQPDLLVLDRALITPAADPIDRIQRTHFPLAVLETVCSMPRLTLRERLSRGRVYLAKPFSERELLDATEHALGGDRRLDRMSTHPSVDRTAAPRHLSASAKRSFRPSGHRSAS